MIEPETPRGRIPAGAIEQWIGISLDETERMRDSNVRYIKNTYPLVDARMRRSDCERWLTDHGYRIPPKSSCIGCPFHDDQHWRAMKDNQPEGFADAVDYDRRIRAEGSFNRQALRGNVFLHNSLKPLDEVDLSTREDHGQQNLFINECSGHCGV